MGSTDIQVCMDASNWLQGPISHEPSTDDAMLACGQQLIERRLRPQHDQSLKCPRCDSTHTKFCYYNNYSLSQPRYFCKTCRRYWTKGGTLRNIPVGGGCRKNTKKPSISSSASAGKKPSTDLHHSSSSSPLLNPQQHNNFPSSFPLSILGHEQTHIADLQLAFPEQIEFSTLSLHHAENLFANNQPGPAGFMLDNTARFEHDNFGGMIAAEKYPGNFHSGSGPFFGLGSGCQRLMLPYDEENGVFDDVKPNGKLENQQQQGGRDSFGYNFGGFGSWTGLMNGYGASTTNPLV